MAAVVSQEQVSHQALIMSYETSIISSRPSVAKDQWHKKSETYYNERSTEEGAMTGIKGTSELDL